MLSGATSARHEQLRCLVWTHSERDSERRLAIANARIAEAMAEVCETPGRRPTRKSETPRGVFANALKRQRCSGLGPIPGHLAACEAGPFAQPPAGHRIT